MEVEIKVPGWVDTNNEGICMLFAFLRRIAIEYKTNNLDVYGYDIRKITDREDDSIHEYLSRQIDTKYCKIAKLSREHFVFQMSNYMKDVNIVTIKNPEAIVRWAYLMGCSNYNLVEPDSNSLSSHQRPPYTPMYRMDRELFKFSSRK